MRLIQTFLLLVLVAVPAAADPLRNGSRFGVDMRAGPGFQFALIHVLDPGEVADRGRCEPGGRWCLLTAGNKVGWVDTTGLVPPRSAAPQLDGVSPIRNSPIESTVLGGGAVTSRPLPDAITNAVRGATDAGPGQAGIPPGARSPFMFATDAPFYNVMDGPVNLRAGPSTDFAVLGQLPPGTGGRIDICDASQQWCRMTVEGGPVAWVKMTLVGLRRVDVPPLAPGDVAAR